MKLHSTIYTSRPSRELGPFEVLSILDVSRRNNERAAVTEVSFCSSLSFVQVLEGPHANVMATFQRICQDTRHVQVRELWSGEVEERQFPGWYMRSTDQAETRAMDFDGLGAAELDDAEIREVVRELGGRASARWIGERRPAR